MDPDNIGIDKNTGIAMHTAVNMGFRGKIHEIVRLVLLEYCGNLLGVSNVTPYKYIPPGLPFTVKGR